MVDGVGQSGVSRARLDRIAYERTAKTARTADNPSQGQTAGSTSLAADLASALTSPVDPAKVAAIRSAIAQGRYPVDPQKIAERMIELDLPRSEFA